MILCAQIFRRRGDKRWQGVPSTGRLVRSLRYTLSLVIRKILFLIAFAILVLALTHWANQAPPEPPSGFAFWLYAQKVVECTPTEITLIDQRQAESHFVKDESWPDCAVFGAGELFDFHLSRGEKTHFIGDELTAWWRKTL